MTTSTAKLEQMNAQLAHLFKIFNDRYFSGALTAPVIAVQTNGNNVRAMGWCTTKKIWKDKETNESYYEITICAEYLFRGVHAISSTLIHEMVHLYHLQNGVKDVTRQGRYHNKKFKERAEICGLSIEHDANIGWSVSELSEEAKRFVDGLGMEKAIFSLTRKNPLISEQGEDNESDGGENGDGQERPKKRQSFIKYECPKCGLKARAARNVNLKCGDCDVKLECDEV